MRFTKKFNIDDKFKIKDIVYHSDSKTLTVEFKSGRTHIYSQVEAHVYDEFRKSKNKNQYLRKNIYQIYPREVI
jgi:hypothetical protein